MLTVFFLKSFTAVDLCRVVTLWVIYLLLVMDLSWVGFAFVDPNSDLDICLGSFKMTILVVLW